jgi:poly(3-hydroxybutyrate) depolymerase
MGSGKPGSLRLRRAAQMLGVKLLSRTDANCRHIQTRLPCSNMVADQVHVRLDGLRVSVAKPVRHSRFAPARSDSPGALIIEIHGSNQSGRDII